MLEKVIRRKWYLQKHLDAPMLKEREEFLGLKMQQGYSHSYLLGLADYMLLVVNMLKMSDDNRRKIPLSEIEQAAIAWSNTQKNHPMKRKMTPSSKTKFISIAYAWLGHIGLLDDPYTDNSSILNRLFSRRHHKLRYLTYPMKAEREAHLQTWEKKGAATQTLREIAAYQLHAIDLLHVEEGRKVTEEELNKAADIWMAIEKSGKRGSDGRFGKKRFVSHVRDWLVFMERYVHPDDAFPLKAQVQEYLMWLRNAKGYSHKTIESRYSMLKTFMKKVSPVSMHKITPQMLDAFLASRQEAGCCRRTIAGTTSVLRDFFRYGESQGWNNSLLESALKSPRQYGHEDLPSYVPWNVVQSILVEKSRGDGIVIRDYAILLLLSVYGLRCSEVTGLRLKDIDWRKEQLFLRRAKGCKPQVMPLLHVVGDAIIRYIREIRHNDGDSEHLFIGYRAPYGRLSSGVVYRAASEALKKRGIALRHYGPHSFRHGCATHLINTGYSLKEIADLLGHMRLDTTRIYAKVDRASLRSVADMEWESVL